MSPQAAQLFHQITHCENLCQARADAQHPCSTILSTQDENEVQCPEPWRGHIEKAKILFISSNPSIGEEDASPRVAVAEAVHYAPEPEWRNERVESHFDGAFTGGQPPWIQGGIYPLLHGAANQPVYGRAVPFWNSVRCLARLLLSHEPTPGIDYALTEVVHCKSRAEIGVSKALRTCADLYLKRILCLSPARLVVVVGSRSRIAVRRLDVAAPVPPRLLVHCENFCGRTRKILFLSHPSPRVRPTAKFPQLPDQQTAQSVRDWLG